MQRSRTARSLVRWTLTHLWTPVGAGVKTEEEVDALAICLFGDGWAGREQISEIDHTIAEVPGLEDMRLLGDYLDGALARAAERPGWAGVVPTGMGTAQTNGQAPAPTHWARAGAVRDD